MKDLVIRESDEQPILILDIKLSRDTPQKLTIYEGDNPEQVVNRFSDDNQIDDVKRQRLLEVIRMQIAEYYNDDDETQSRGDKLLS